MYATTCNVYWYPKFMSSSIMKGEAFFKLDSLTFPFCCGVSEDERSQRLVELRMFGPMGQLVTQGLLESMVGRHDKITKAREKKVSQRKSLKHR